MKVPCITLLGTRDQLVREGGSNNKDGYGYSKIPDGSRAPRPIAKRTWLSRVFFR
jgi:hypothetical protein